MKTFSQEEAAIILGISRPSIYYKQEKGHLPEPVTADAIRSQIARLRREADGIERRLLMAEAAEPQPVL